MEAWSLQSRQLTSATVRELFSHVIMAGMTCRLRKLLQGAQQLGSAFSLTTNTWENHGTLLPWTTLIKVTLNNI